MFSYYFNIGLIYVVIGFAVALFYYFVLKRPVIGTFWTALAIAVVGSFLGGVIDYFFSDLIKRLANLAQAVNIFPALFVSFLLLWLFSKFNRGDDR